MNFALPGSGRPRAAICVVILARLRASLRCLRRPALATTTRPLTS